MTFWDNALAEEGSEEGPGAEGELYQGNEWDGLRLSGLRVPGLVTVTVNEIARRLQNKKENGSDGASPTFRGLNPAKLDIEIMLWTPDQLRLWESMLPIIFPRSGKGTDGLSGIDISHPNTALLGIRAIVIESITGLMPGPMHGTRSTRIKCFEFQPPKKRKAVKSVVSAAVPVKESFRQDPIFAGPKNAPDAPSQTQDTIPDFLRRTPQQGGT